MIVVVATDEERKMAKKRFKGHWTIQTGVGGVNVLRKLKYVPRWLKILNYGYCGSNVIPRGTEVRVKKCKLYHPNIEYEEPTYYLRNGTVDCYTSNDFVLKTDIQEPCVFDMELAYILAMGFKRVESVKIVSDNLSLEQYEEEINDRES